jgi:hypothetical protein
VLVVNEPALVEALNRLRGEWAERSGGELSAVVNTWAEVRDAKQLDADLVIFPARYLGELCVRGQLRPVRASVLESENVKATDYFPLVRNELIKWDGQVMALPLGIEAAAVGQSAASTRGIALLIAAAPNAVSNDRIGVLFDSETMKPRITEPAFVTALAELAEKHSQSGEANGSAPSPAQGGDTRVAVLGNNDRLIAVTTTSRNAATAFKLLEWLAQADMSAQLSRVGEGKFLPPRRSLASSTAWNDAAKDSGATSQAGALDAALKSERFLMIPRIPGIDDYLAALDVAADAAVKDKMPPAEALQKAADQWEQITNARGREAQHAAYLKSLGISGK